MSMRMIISISVSVRVSVGVSVGVSSFFVVHSAESGPVAEQMRNYKHANANT